MLDCIGDLLQLHLVDTEQSQKAIERLCAGNREQKGVKVRIELGPRDAQKSQACLAISTTPGEVAKKSTFQVGLPQCCHFEFWLQSCITPTSS